VEGSETQGVPKGSITVVKEASPQGKQKFKFRGDLGNFKLTDWDTGATNKMTFDGLDPGTYVITEVVPKFWMLMSIDIDDDDSYADETKATATIILGAGETVTVTFTNEMIPPPHEIVFLGTRVNPDLTVTFCYRVTSGVPAISHWELWSSLFKEGALVSVSESPYEYKPEEQMLKFDKGYKDYETRVVCFTLDMGLYYSGYQIVPIPYSIKAGGSVYNGYVKGPESPQISQSPRRLNH